MKLFIEPVDTWLFRDGRPFSAGGDHRAQSLFPPLPTTVQGILRSNELVVQKVDLQDRPAIRRAVGTSTTFPPGFRVHGPIVARAQHQQGLSTIDLLFPLPEDAINVGASVEGRFRALAPSTSPQGTQSACPLPLVLWDSGMPSKREGGWWLPQSALRRYLTVPNAEVQGVPTTDLFVKDPRFGIGRNSVTHTAEEGMLFEVEYILPRDGVGLFVEVSGLQSVWSQTGVLAAGGESRAGRYRQISGPALTSPKGLLPKRFKLYLATPTYFGRGWLPADWSPFFDGRVELVCAAVGRYLSLGGFDMSEASESAAAHKAARRYVPAGSVYYFESSEPASLKVDCISDDPAPIGWGHVIVGSW